MAERSAERAPFITTQKFISNKTKKCPKRQLRCFSSPSPAPAPALAGAPPRDSPLLLPLASAAASSARSAPTRRPDPPLRGGPSRPAKPARLHRRRAPPRARLRRRVASRALAVQAAASCTTGGASSRCFPISRAVLDLI